MKKIVYVGTHENVSLEYETANLGSRFIAYFFDMAIQILAIILIIIGIILKLYYSGAENIYDTAVYNIFADDLYNSIAVVTIAIFVINYLYFIVFEMLMNGATPGKKLAGIRVVSATGEPINLIMSIIRNILRTADMLPGNYLIGCILIIIDRKSRRLGDIAANTIVVKNIKDKEFLKKLETFFKDSEINVTNNNEQLLHIDVDTNLETIESQPSITKNEYEILSKYLKSRKLYNMKSYDFKLYSYFTKKLNTEITETSIYYIAFPYLNKLLNENQIFYEKK